MKTPLVLALAILAVPALAQEKKPLGYQDTPVIPGTKWHVHDGERPQPKVITPGEPPTLEKSSATTAIVTAGENGVGSAKTTTTTTVVLKASVGTAPSDATVLFDGQDLSAWKMEKDGAPAAWKVETGYFEVVPKTGYMMTKAEFGPDVQLHLEFATPPPQGDGQGRGNSGVFLYGRYEIQILDSYENPTYPDGQATGIYGYRPPLVNASRKPGEWQTYDIIFEGPRFKEGKLEKPAITTILHNGVVTQNRTVLIGETPHKKVGTYTPHGEKGPIKLQDHGNPMRFRNIWIREITMPAPEDIGTGPELAK